jgi:predicted Fe-Mo cluster-binding NifX family protein
MRIAIATDREQVASHFGCCPMFTIADVDQGAIQHSVVVPNPGCNHTFWLDLFVRNSVTHVIAGRMGPTAYSVFAGRGLTVLAGVEGDIIDVVRRLDRGELTPAGPAVAPAGSCCDCLDS